MTRICSSKLCRSNLWRSVFCWEEERHDIELPVPVIEQIRQAVKK